MAGFFISLRLQHLPVRSKTKPNFPTEGPFALKQALRSHLAAGLRELGLTMPQYASLTFLRDEPGASNAALARRAFVTPQTM